jgi:nucleoside-diphosphate-sugar epimerase
LTQLGWTPKIPLKAGIESTYLWFRQHIADARL